MAAAKRLFRLEPGEGGVVFVLGFILMANAMAMQISGIVAVSGFLSTGGVNQILIVLFVDYALILLAGGLQSLIVDKFRRVDLMGWIILAFALAFIILRMMFLFQAPDSINYAVMYLIAEQQFVFFPLVFWILANDIFKMHQTKRLFPIISGWNFFGKLIGIGIAASSPTLFARLGIAPEEILTVNILIYLISYMILLVGLNKVEVRKTVQKQESVKQTLKEGWDFVKEVASFRYIMVAILLLAVADTIIEFRFLVVTDKFFTDQASYQFFFSMYRLGTTMIALLIQAILTGWLIKKMQLRNTFFILPLVMVSSAVGLVLVPGLSMAVGAMVLVKLIRDTINETSRKSFQGLVPEERRGRVSTMMESYLPAVGTMLACLVTGALVWTGIQRGVDMAQYYILISIGAGLGALWAIFKVWTNYDKSLLNWRMKRRQRKGSTLLLKRLEAIDD